MLQSAQARSWDGRGSSDENDTSSVQYPLPYDVMTHLWDLASYFDTQRISVLPCAGSELSIPLGPGAHEPAAGAWTKHCKHPGACRALKYRTACRETDSPFTRCREENEHQNGSRLYLAELHGRPTVPTVAGKDLLCVPEDLEHFYSVTNHACWSREFH